MKRTFMILLSVVLLLSLAACGAAGPEPAPEAAAEATAEVTTEATEPTVSEAERLYALGMEALESDDADAAYEYFEAARAMTGPAPSAGWAWRSS